MDLSTTYMGLELPNPLVASPSPLTETVEDAVRLAEAGISAVVLPSLFEEEIELESERLHRHLSQFAESYAEALSYFPEMAYYHLGPDPYMERIRRVKEAVDIPVIASLNGATPGGWTEYAWMMEQAGADALELNMYFIPADPRLSSAELEEQYLEVIRQVRAQVRVPLAVKVGPFFTALPHMAKRMAEAGANGLVLFNRFYQPDIDLETLEVVPHLTLSTSEELRLRLRWTAILYGRVPLDLAVTGGVHTHEDVLKAMMAGARVAMLTSELLMGGPGRVREILDDLERWMEEHEYESIRQMQGSMSHRNVADPTAYERSLYIRVLHSYPPLRWPR